VVRIFIGQQLQLLWDRTGEYPLHSSTRHRHLAVTRQQLGWRFPTGRDKQVLETWLRLHGARDAPTEEDLCECAYARLRAFGIELPSEAELRRIVRAALHVFFDDLYRRVTAELTETVRATLDALLACFIHGRTMDSTDDTVRMLLEVIRRIETQTEYLHKALILADLPWGGPRQVEPW
jgi:hypothetical protein